MQAYEAHMIVRALIEAAVSSIHHEDLQQALRQLRLARELSYTYEGGRDEME